MRALLLAALGIALTLWLLGCGTWRIELVQMPMPDRLAWEQQITTAVNEHTHRLDALETRCPPPLSIGGP